MYYNKNSTGCYGCSTVFPWEVHMGIWEVTCHTTKTIFKRYIVVHFEVSTFPLTIEEINKANACLHITVFFSLFDNNTSFAGETILFIHPNWTTKIVSPAKNVLLSSRLKQNVDLKYFGYLSICCRVSISYDRWCIVLYQYISYYNHTDWLLSYDTQWITPIAFSRPTVAYFFFIISNLCVNQ